MFVVDGVIYIRQAIGRQAMRQTETVLRAGIIDVGSQTFGGAVIADWRMRNCVLCCELRCPATRPELIITPLEDIAAEIRAALETYCATRFGRDAVLIDHIGITYRYPQDERGDSAFPLAS